MMITGGTEKGTNGKSRSLREEQSTRSENF